MRKNSIIIATFLLLTTACVSLISKQTDEEAWNDYFKNLISQQQVERSVASDTRAGIKILRKILETIPFRNFMLACDHRDCYQSQLVLAFDQAFARVMDQKIAINKDEYVAEQKLFLRAYDYENVLQWIESFHQMILSGVELRASQRAVELVQDCESSSDGEEKTIITNFTPFLGGITYLPRSFYSCVNAHWRAEQEQLLNDTTSRLGITIKTELAKNWILQKQISPRYRKTFTDIFNKHQHEETLKWNQSWKEISGNIDWKKPIEELLLVEVPLLRKQFRFINIEALLTEEKQSKK